MIEEDVPRLWWWRDTDAQRVKHRDTKKRKKKGINLKMEREQDGKGQRTWEAPKVALGI